MEYIIKLQGRSIKAWCLKMYNRFSLLDDGKKKAWGCKRRVDYLYRF